jgi:mono/diheme cytochrome c family protein
MIRYPVAALVSLSLIAGAARLAAQNPTETSLPRPRTPPGPASPAPPQTPAVPKGNVEEGRKVYVSHGCYQCHGFEGQGSVAGPRLGPRPAPYPYFSSYVRKPTLLMPPYTSKVLSDQDVAHIYAYLQARTTPPALETIDLLK